MRTDREYRIKASGRGPDELGTCERCGKHCAQHYMQQSRKVGYTRGWSTAGFGHVECLRNGPWSDAPVVEVNHAH